MKYFFIISLSFLLNFNIYALSSNQYNHSLSYLKNQKLSPSTSFFNSLNLLIQSLTIKKNIPENMLFGEEIENIITLPYTGKLEFFFDSIISFYINGIAKDHYKALKVENKLTDVSIHCMRFAASIYQLLNTDINNLTKEDIISMHKTLKPFNNSENHEETKKTLAELKKITNLLNPSIWFYISLVHDLGKLKGPNAGHEERSYKILQESGLTNAWYSANIDKFGQNDVERAENLILTNIIIKHHAVFGLTYSGELNSKAISILFKDPLVLSYITDKNSTDKKNSINLKKAYKMLHLLNVVTIFDTAAVMKEGVVNLRTIKYKLNLVKEVLNILLQANGKPPSFIEKNFHSKDQTLKAVNDRIKRLVFFVDKNLDKKLNNKNFNNFNAISDDNIIVKELLPHTNFSVFNYPFGHYAWSNEKSRFQDSSNQQALKFFSIPDSCNVSANLNKFFKIILKGGFALNNHIDPIKNDENFLSALKQKGLSDILIKIVDEDNRSRFDNDPEKLASLPRILNQTINLTERIYLLNNRILLLDKNDTPLPVFLQKEDNEILIIIKNEQQSVIKGFGNQESLKKAS